jgi:hypothetical protein
MAKVTIEKVEQQNRLICVEKSHLDESAGEALFDAKGSPSDKWKGIERLLTEYEADLERSREMCGILSDYGLLEPFTMQAKLNKGGGPLAMTGMHRVAEAKIEHLNASQLKNLVKKGILSRVYAHLLSLENFGRLPSLRIHGDCHAGNILWRENGPLFVDLDDCMSGPRIQDLWMFLSGDPASQQSAWAAIMEGYELFGEFDVAELTLVEALRSSRILHHAAWIASRWGDPAFPRAFPWFGDARFWERHISDLFEQLAAMDDPPILSR